MPRASRLLPVGVAVGLGVASVAAIVGLAGSQPAKAAVSWPAHVFAPYVDTGLSNTTLTTAAADYGTQFFQLAFVDGAGCQWSLPQQSSWQSQVSALQAEGGDVSISFGGYTVDTDGDDLGAQCSSAGAMAAQVESVVTTMKVTHLDFDIESNEETDTADLTLTAQALAQVRSWASANGTQLSISYTIPVLPTGLTGSGEDEAVGLELAVGEEPLVDVPPVKAWKVWVNWPVFWVSRWVTPSVVTTDSTCVAIALAEEQVAPRSSPSVSTV